MENEYKKQVDDWIKSFEKRIVNMEKISFQVNKNSAILDEDYEKINHLSKDIDSIKEEISYMRAVQMQLFKSQSEIYKLERKIKALNESMTLLIKKCAKE